MQFSSCFPSTVYVPTGLSTPCKNIAFVRTVMFLREGLKYLWKEAKQFCLFFAKGAAYFSSNNRRKEQNYTNTITLNVWKKHLQSLTKQLRRADYLTRNTFVKFCGWENYLLNQNLKGLGDWWKEVFTRKQLRDELQGNCQTKGGEREKENKNV